MEEPNFSDKIFKKNENTSQTSQKFTWTFHNYTDETFIKIKNFPDWIRWIGFGREVCPTTGTPHLQGFLYTWEPVRLSKFKLTFLKNRHMEIVRGNFEQNETYCNKDKQWEEYGERPQQGRRNDILGAKRRLDSGIAIGDLMEDEAFFGIVMRNERSLSKYAEQQRFKRMCAEGYKKPEVHIRVGPKGSGKTKYVYEQHGFANVFPVPDVTGKWHDGYLGQPVLLYDDVDPCKAPEIEYFKHITDGYPRHYPFKGGFCYIRPTHIYITSNHQPSEWWKGISPGDWEAIKRRISTITLVYTHKPDLVIYHKNGLQEEDVTDSQPQGSEEVQQDVEQEEA